MESERPISAERLAWLESEAERWRAEGLVSAESAAAIVARYVAAVPARAVSEAPSEASPRALRSAVGLVVTLGGLLVAVGLVLVVAANVDYDRVGPLARFAAVAAVWLVAVAAAELGVGHVAALRLLRGPLRALAVAAYGGTIFQAAQSLQVPAYEAGLLAAWALGSLAYAYAVGSAGALVLAIGVGVAWYAFTLEAGVDSGSAFVLGLGLPVPLLFAVAVAHARTALAALAGPWRGLGAVLGLVGLFSAAIPGAAGDSGVPALALAVLALGVLGCLGVAVRGDENDRLEAVVAVGVGLGVLLLVAVAPAETTDVFSERGPSGAQVLFTLLGIVVFVAGAVAVAVLGIRRRAPRMVDGAAAALFVFVVLQSFGFLAPLASGSVLVLALGVVLVAGGVLVDRGRRRLREEVAP